MPTDVRHFGSQAYNEPLDIRRADFTGAACCTPFFLFLSPLSSSTPYPATCVSFFLLLSLALSHTPVDLLGGGSDRCTRQVFGQCAAPDFNLISDETEVHSTQLTIFRYHKISFVFLLFCFELLRFKKISLLLFSIVCQNFFRQLSFDSRRENL